MPTFRGLINQLVSPIYDWSAKAASQNSSSIANRRYVDNDWYYFPREVEFKGTPEERAMAAESSIWVMRCIDYITNKINDTEWHIVNAQGDVIDQHPFINAYLWSWLKFQQDIFSRWLLMKIVHGNTYIEKLKVRETDIPGGLYVLNSQNVTLEVLDGRLQYYRYNVAGHEMRYMPDELFYDKVPAVTSDLRGKSPMDRALAEVNIEGFNRGVVRSWLLGDTKEGAVLALRQGAEPLSEEDLNRVLEEWKKSGAGPHSGFSTRLLNGPFELQKFGNKPPDPALAEDSRQNICVVIGVDPALVGAALVKDPLGANTTLREKKALTAENTIRPYMRHFEKYINHVILPWLSPDVEGEFAFDMSEINALINYNTDIVMQERQDVQAGLMTLHEYQERRGIPKSDQDAIIIPAGTVMIRPEKLAEYIEKQEQQVLGDQQQTLDDMQSQINRLSAGQTEDDSPSGENADNDEMVDEAETEAAQKAAVSLIAPNGGVAYVNLPVDSIEEIHGLLRELKGTYPNIVWQEPETMHITLAYCKDVDNDTLDQIIEQIHPKRIPIEIIGYALFMPNEANGNRFVLYLNVVHTDELIAFQREVYNLFTKRGLPMSEFSQPSQWQPHITLAYIEQESYDPLAFNPREFDMRLHVHEVAISRDDYWLVERLVAKSAVEELAQWERLTLRKPDKAVKFETNVIDNRAAFQIRLELSQRDLTDKAMVKAIFQEVREAWESGDNGHHLFSGKVAVVDENTIAGAMDYFESIGAQEMVDQFNTMLAAVDNNEEELR